MDSSIQTECGIYSVISYDSFYNIHNNMIEGLMKIQHRGQESFGISIQTDKYNTIGVMKRKGLVKDINKNKNYDILDDKQNIISKISMLGHVRYSTTSSKEITDENIQPLVGNSKVFGQFSIAHNGHIPDHDERSKLLNIELDNKDTDTKFLLKYIENYNFKTEYSTKQEYIVEVCKSIIKEIPCAFCFVLMDCEGRFYIMRDKVGVRPLSFMIKDKTCIVASETCAFPSQDTDYISVKPGELWTIEFDYNTKKFIKTQYNFKIESPLGKDIGIDSEKTDTYNLINQDDTLTTFDIEDYKEGFCSFELMYFMNPESKYKGEKVGDIRKRLGKKLAEKDVLQFEDKKNVVVIGCPRSGYYAGYGYAEYYGYTYEQYIRKKDKAERSFIMPNQKERQNIILKKYEIDFDKIEGKDLILVDDSIVRGNTMKKLIEQVKLGNPKSIHIRVASPPIRAPCYFGIDFPTYTELVAHETSIEEIRQFINIDTLEYLTEEDMKDVFKSKDICVSCFSNEYKEKMVEPFQYKEKYNKKKSFKNSKRNISIEYTE